MTFKIQDAEQLHLEGEQEPPIAKFDGEFRWLSNFWPSVHHVSIAPNFGSPKFFTEEPVLEDWEVPTLEHAYQAYKTTVPEERRRVCQAPSAGAAKREGRYVTMRPDWDTVKIRIMRSLLKEKFENPDLRKKLLATGNRELIEGNHWNDTFWGVCRGIGSNHLGKLLMELREELRNAASNGS